MTSKFAQVLAKEDFQKLEDSLRTPGDGVGERRKSSALRGGLGTYLPAAFKFTDDDDEDAGQQRKAAKRKGDKSSSMDAVVALDLALDSVWDQELKSLGTSMNTGDKKKKNILLKMLMQKRESSRVTMEFTTGRSQEESLEILQSEMLTMFFSVKTRCEFNKIIVRCRGKRQAFGEIKDDFMNPETWKECGSPRGGENKESKVQNQEQAIVIDITSSGEMITEIRVRGERMTAPEVQHVFNIIMESFTATGADGVLKHSATECRSPRAEVQPDFKHTSFQDLKSASVFT